MEVSLVSMILLPADVVIGFDHREMCTFAIVALTIYVIFTTALDFPWIDLGKR